jgi:hypothetical protein
MELVDCLRFQNLGVGDAELGFLLGNVWLVGLVCLFVCFWLDGWFDNLIG